LHHILYTRYTLLYFYDPDCSSCKEVTYFITMSAIVSKTIDNGILKILAFYPEKNPVLWKKHMKEIPDTWINGYDKTGLVNDKQLYDLKALPTLYLLDREKKVILKDVTIEVIIDYLTKNNSMVLTDDLDTIR